jgi:serine/threonine protein kinase
MTCSVKDEVALEATKAVDDDFSAPSLAMLVPLIDQSTSLQDGSSKQVVSAKNDIIKPTPWNRYPETTDEAREHVAAFLNQSRRLNSRKAIEVPSFDARELHLGRWLGSGGFSHVEELRGFLHIPGGSQRAFDAPSRNRLSKLLGGGSRLVGHDDPTEREPSSCSISENPHAHELGYETHHGNDAQGGEAEHATVQLPEEVETPSLSVNTEAARQFLVHSCLRSSGEARYAIKRLRKEIVHDKKQYPSGAMDLAVEALFLANLQHPNIIKLRAIGTADPFSSKPSHDDYYFLLLDRLYDTLTARMLKWKERKRKLKTLVGRITDVAGRQRLNLLDEKLAAAFDLSAAIVYLKENKIIHRDIKPDNLGFDIVSVL